MPDSRFRRMHGPYWLAVVVLIVLGMLAWNWLFGGM